MLLRVLNAKQHAREMGKSGRPAGECQIDTAFLEHLMKKQNGKCYYSGLPMFSGPDVTDWKCSVERLDDSIGYTAGNVALCCYEFNVAAKWTPAKICAVWALRQQAADLEALQPILLCLKSKRRRADGQLRRDLSHLFVKERAAVKFIHGLAKRAKATAKRRSNVKRKRKADTSGECSIDVHAIVDKIEQQGGRCFISNLGMALQQLQQLADAGLAATARIQARLEELNRKAAARAAARGGSSSF
jgi:hypothetical protein